MYRPLINTNDVYTDEPISFIQEFFLEVIPSTLQSVFAINMKDSFEVYLIDPNTRL